ncbi:MAG: phosphoribosyltransferase [Chlamydiia bacterium]|nr:phosphoribosyltransferase [Chlamydiia bacterium]
MKSFHHRKAAGRELAKALVSYAEAPNTQVIALPRGGVVVGEVVSTTLHLPLDIVSPRKIGAPFNPELAIGAITETGEGFFSTRLIKELGISKEYLDKTVAEEKVKAKWRLDHYRGGRPPRDLEGQVILIIDDGIATGSTMHAAIQTVRTEKASCIIVAVPVAPLDTVIRLEKEVDKVVCLYSPTVFFAVGQFYEEFEQTTDDEVISLLNSKMG